MRYSLLSRFRGTWLGAAAGETGFPPLVPKESSSWRQVAQLGGQSLVRCGQLNLTDWVEQVSSSGKTAAASSASSSEAAIASLPVALFFHEDEIWLGHQLQQAAKVWLQDAETAAGTLAVGYAIASALKEKLFPAKLLPQTCNYIDRIMGSERSDVGKFLAQLNQLQAFIEKGAPLESAAQLWRESKTSNAPILIALYCFLTVPEDFSLAVVRARLESSQPQIAGAIAGAISGGYNGGAAIPVAWQIAANRGDMFPNHLLAVWSGAASFAHLDRVEQLAIAAPRVMQARS